MDFLKQIIKNSGNEDATTVEAGLDADVAGFLNTGSFAFNALVSGSLYGGIPGNKITALAGESSTGKTWFALSLVEQFLKDYPKGAVIYFDTEQAVTTEMFESRKIDGSRVAVFPVSTIEQFKHQSLKIVEQVLEQKEEDRIPMMFVLDSLGMLSTEKEVTDAAEGKNVRDMTRAQGVRSTFRVLSVKLGKAGIPLVVTNHTYNVVGSYVPTRDMSGGEGLKYSASTIVYLSKKKDKDATGEVVGNIIHCKTYKSRFTKENQEVDVQLNFETGLNPFYGLIDIALKHGVFKKVSTRIELPDGTTAFEKNINENPEKYFTPAVMEKLEEAVAKEFKYGGPDE
jgi:RecA/RadA recombinase